MEKDRTYASYENMLTTARKSSGDVQVIWDSFGEFLRDMGERPEGLVLCRKKWTADFCKENCYWGTPEQSRHAQTITWDGRTMTIKEWAEETGLSWRTIYYRLSSGWEVEDILFWPSQKEMRANA